MAKRPTIALALICKNEVENLPRLLESVEGCFDEIHITDTGSTDGTVELLKFLQQGDTHKLFIHHFEWCDDFSAARNYSFSFPETDYIMWMDCDDVLKNKEHFILWRDNTMKLCNYWYANYDYAHDESGRSVCTFLRERVVARKNQFKWKYFIHEGMNPETGIGQVRADVISTWRVKHCRTPKDLEKDKSRNIRIFEKNKDILDVRMKYYYGKELYENQKPMEAFFWLMQSIGDEKLFAHDRLLCIQYACYAAIQCGQHQRAIVLAHQGLQLDPNRAEYHTIIGDCYIKNQEWQKAIPFFQAAKACTPIAMAAQFSFPHLYEAYPREQLARLYFHVGNFEQSFKEAEECYEIYKNPGSKALLDELQKIKKITSFPKNPIKTKEIVFTTTPQCPYEWDEEKYKTKPMGGSETACIEMAAWLKKLTGLPVKVFNPRLAPLRAESGVEYLPINTCNEYLSEHEPLVHIAWRHNTKLTNAPTYLWCHDLFTPGVDQVQNFDWHLCLSHFHRNYVRSVQGLPHEKIAMTRNGINPERFYQIADQRNPYKVIFPSSPDRGLDRAIEICKIARKTIPEIEFHIYYELENLNNDRFRDLYNHIKKEINENPWIVYHGFIEQKKLALEMMTAAVWLYPANFIESFCITAIEALAAGVYPVVREIGALQDTLRLAADLKMASLMDLGIDSDEELKEWAKELVAAVSERRYHHVRINIEDYSWQSVAKEWIRLMELPSKSEIKAMESTENVAAL